MTKRKRMNSFKSRFGKLEKPYYKMVAKCRNGKKSFVVERTSKLFSAKYFCELCNLKYIKKSKEIDLAT